MPSVEMHMTMLLLEIPLALLALRRGWRAAPALLLALPLLVLWFEPRVAASLLPVLGQYFDAAGTARALAHVVALLGLGLTAVMDPPEELAELRASADTKGRKVRRAGSLYQI